ncbi:MAG TPA: hypothetical protein V6D25_28760 [Leptolyngbyaceae cyanobacterium]
MLNNQNQEPAKSALNFLDNVIQSQDSIEDTLLSQLNVKTPHSNKSLKRRITKLDIEVPTLLSESFGYQGNARWIQIFWASDPINKPICSDGKNFYFSNKLSWEIFIENIVGSFTALDTSPITYSFLLDRWEHIIYVGTKETVSELINNNECLGLLSSSDRKSNTGKIREYAATFTIAAILGATVAGVLFSIGLGLYQAVH